MRWTVLSSDALIFFPAVLYFAYVYYTSRSSRHRNDVAWHIAILLINPCLMLIDHGHFQVWKFLLSHALLYCNFNSKLGGIKLVLIHIVLWQYNCISLGLTLAAVAAILSQKELVASFLFTLALNHKQVRSHSRALRYTFPKSNFPNYFQLSKLYIC